MKLRRGEEKGDAIVFEEIEPFFVDLLHRIPASADPGENAAANERLFGAPVEDDPDRFNDDWKEFVEPEIRDLFRSATEIVAEDLRALPKPASPHGDEEEFVFDPASFNGEEQSLEVPRRHIDAWMTTLNRARLVIAAKNDFGEEAMDEDLQFPPLTNRDLSMFQVHFYDFLQQVLLRELGFD